MAEKTKRFAKKRANGDPITEQQLRDQKLKKYELYKRGLDVNFKSGGIASGMRRFNRGGRVGYKGGTLVGKYKTRTGGTGGRSK